MKKLYIVAHSNREFFPPEPMKAAREATELELIALGHDVVMLPESVTKFGALQSEDEGITFAEFAMEQAEAYIAEGGKKEDIRILLDHPNFGTEQANKVALKPLFNAGYKALIMGAPDSDDKMAPKFRRDAFCGLFSTMDVFRQNGWEMGKQWYKFSPHVSEIGSDRWKAQINAFESVLTGQKEFSDYFKPIPFEEKIAGQPDRNVLDNTFVTCFGAPTTQFDTIDIDVCTLRANGIDSRMHDFSGILKKMHDLNPASDAYTYAKRALYSRVDNWKDTPDQAIDKLVRLEAVLNNEMDDVEATQSRIPGSRLAYAVRCWTDPQIVEGISPCVVMGGMNDRNATACEVDIGNAIMMEFMRDYTKDDRSGLISCKDWNNNVGVDPANDDEVYLMHCGPDQKGWNKEGYESSVGDHEILSQADAIGPGKGWGCHKMRMKACDMIYGSIVTRGDDVIFYLGKGEITDKEVPDDYFGSAGIARIENAQTVYQNINALGGRHHVSIAEVEKGKADEVLDKMIGDLNAHASYKVVDMRKACETEYKLPEPAKVLQAA